MGNDGRRTPRRSSGSSRSAEAGRKWIVCLDEIGPANTGVKPDADDPDHDEVRKQALWGNLMAGGAGCEWYFGYKLRQQRPELRGLAVSRERMWDQTRWALEFFQRHLPFAEMQPADELTARPRTTTAWPSRARSTPSTCRTAAPPNWSFCRATTRSSGTIRDPAAHCRKERSERSAARAAARWAIRRPSRREIGPCW